MANKESFFKILKTIDGKPYQRYKDLEGTFDMEEYTLRVDSVQSSPVSRPSVLKASVSMAKAGFPADTYSNDSRRIALGDLIARRFWESCRANLKNASIPRPGQEILERGSVNVRSTHVEVVFSFHLPSAGKNAAGKTATEMFSKLDGIIRESLFFRSYKQSKLYNHIETSENADLIRSSLKEKGLTAFIAEGSILPRRDDGLAPMIDASPFVVLKDMYVTFTVPNGEPVKGMGIREGFTVVMGATGSGRSTFIEAIASGTHNHIPGDGREHVITAEDALYVSRSGGRHTGSVDASMFLNSEDASMFSSPSVRDALSQSVTMAEAAEVGCGLFVIDEDTSYNGIIARDEFLRSVVPDSEEAVIPVTEMASMFKKAGISVIVACSSGEAASRADTVVVMSNHAPTKVIANKQTPKGEFTAPQNRNPLVQKWTGDVKLSAEKEAGRISVNDMRYPTDESYPPSISAALDQLSASMDGAHTLKEISESAVALDKDSVKVRALDIAMTISRVQEVSMIRRTQK